MDYFVDYDQSTYIKDLQRMSTQYVRDIDAFKAYLHSKGIQVAMAANIDVPNLHRLLDFYYHTLPCYGNSLHITELVFEAMHHPLKNCCVRSNNLCAHLSAVE